MLLNKPFITINYTKFRLFIISAIQWRILIFVEASAGAGDEKPSTPKMVWVKTTEWKVATLEKTHPNHGRPPEGCKHPIEEEHERLSSYQDCNLNEKHKVLKKDIGPAFINKAIPILERGLLNDCKGQSRPNLQKALWALGSGPGPISIMAEHMGIKGSQ